MLRAEELPIALRGARGVPADLIARVIEAIATAQIDVDRGTRLVALLTPQEIEAHLAALERALNPRNEWGADPLFYWSFSFSYAAAA